MNTFEAGVQYNDIKGTVAADRSDNKALLQDLQAKGIAKQNEIVVGSRFSFNENNSQNVVVDSILVYLLEAEEFIEQPERIRAVDVKMSLPEFFSFFKRFDLVMMNDSMIFDDQTIVDGPHYD